MILGNWYKILEGLLQSVLEAIMGQADPSATLVASSTPESPLSLR